MIYTEVGFNPKSGLNKVVLTQMLVLDLNQYSQKVAYTKDSSTLFRLTNAANHANRVCLKFSGLI